MNRRTALDDVFDVEAKDVSLGSKRELVVSGEKQDLHTDDSDASVDSDAALAAENLKKLIEIGQEAAERAANVADESESPQAFDVLSKLLKTMSDMNIQMLDIHEKKKKIKSKTESTSTSTTAGTVNNTSVFVGTTAGLMELIEQSRKGQ